MKVNRENLYKLIAGTLGEDIKKFNPQLSLTQAYKMDSLSILDIALVIEDYTDYEVKIPDDALAELKTAEQYVDYVLEQYNASN